MHPELLDLYDRPELAGLAPIPDALRATAYEDLGPQRRGWIKATLALVEAAHNARPVAETLRRDTLAAQGYIRTTHVRPADWALCLVGPGFASAPRLAAAIMCARLAGLDVIALWPGTRPKAWPNAWPNAGLLAVLELTGVDLAFTLVNPAAPASAATVLDALCASAGADGRILHFGPDCAPFLDAAAARHIPVWQDQPPRLSLDTPNNDILWAHPDAIHTAAAPTVAYTATPGASLAAASAGPALSLGPGLDGCWLHTDLTPDFFYTRRISLELALQDDA